MNNDGLFKIRIISLGAIILCLGVIILCLCDPTQSFGKTFCLAVASGGIGYIATWNLILTLL